MDVVLSWKASMSSHFLFWACFSEGVFTFGFTLRPLMVNCILSMDEVVIVPAFIIDTIFIVGHVVGNCSQLYRCPVIYVHVVLWFAAIILNQDKDSNHFGVREVFRFCL